MDELRRNGSGYYDPTAFKALKKIEREEKEVEIRKGEIWEVEIGNQFRTAVVLAVCGSYSIVLTFTDEPRERRTVQINAQGMRYTEPGMISYKFHDNFVKFIRLTKEEEFADIMNQVSDALGIEKNTPLEEIPFSDAEIKENEIKRLKAELVEVKGRNGKLVEERIHISAELEGLKREQSDAVKAMIERDLYKSQYESLLERVIAKAV